MKKKYAILIITLTLFCGLAQAQNTYVPDDAFEQALINLGYDSGPLNDYVPTANINTVEILNINSKGITDVTGIEDFVLLRELYCQFNFNLLSVDLSGNTYLEVVNTNGCLKLSDIDLSQCTELVNLSCFRNNLSSLDLSTNTKLQYLNCSSNHLTELNLETNTELLELDCTSNNLLGLNTLANSLLTDIVCSSNDITTLNLSNNLLLLNLSCEHNLLTNLDTSTNLQLLSISCASNNLTTLDLSANSQLYSFSGYSNPFTSLNIKNGNNTNIGAFGFYLTNTPNLSCVQVDDVAYSLANWALDEGVSFSADCSTMSAEKFSNVDIAIYPNPVDNVIKVTAKNEFYTISILNTYGEKLIQTNNQEIDLSHLTSGLYFVELVQGDKSIIKKIIKK